MTNTTFKTGLSFGVNAVLDQKVLRFSLSSELADQINTLARFRGRKNWTILGDNGSLNGYKDVQYQLNKNCFHL